MRVYSKGGADNRGRIIREAGRGLGVMMLGRERERVKLRGLRLRLG